MTSTLVSTVPGAVGALVDHFHNVANRNPSLHLGVYVGPPIGSVANNILTVGDPEGNGSLLVNYQQDFVTLPGTVSRRSEEYGLHCFIRCWAGNVDPVARIADAFTIFNGVVEELADDVLGSGALTPSGSWRVSELVNIAAGPLGGEGWGCVFSFVVHVINVRLNG